MSNENASYVVSLVLFVNAHRRVFTVVHSIDRKALIFVQVFQVSAAGQSS